MTHSLYRVKRTSSAPRRSAVAAHLGSVLNGESKRGETGGPRRSLSVNDGQTSVGTATPQESIDPREGYTLSDCDHDVGG
jgi:hypothetical protein